MHKTLHGLPHQLHAGPRKNIYTPKETARMQELMNKRFQFLFNEMMMQWSEKQASKAAKTAPPAPEHTEPPAQKEQSELAAALAEVRALQAKLKRREEAQESEAESHRDRKQSEGKHVKHKKARKHTSSEHSGSDSVADSGDEPEDEQFIETPNGKKAERLAL